MPEPIIGIDLGTTYSCLACWDEKVRLDNEVIVTSRVLSLLPCSRPQVKSRLAKFGTNWCFRFPLVTKCVPTSIEPIFYETSLEAVKVGNVVQGRVHKKQESTFGFGTANTLNRAELYYGLLLRFSFSRVQ